jgi:hypothetical protein
MTSMRFDTSAILLRIPSNTAAIVEVEMGEAEWLLDVLQELFDHYFVGRAQAKKKRDALNAKLADAKKPPLKQP